MDELRKCIFFIGYRGVSSGGGFTPIGTAFLLSFDSCRYLVTAGHVAHQLASDPFIIRINRSDGSAHTVDVDPYRDNTKWFEHPDENVDLAVLEFNFDLRKEGYDSLILPERALATESVVTTFDIGVGDICYAVGLFSLMAGKQRNLPVVHTGNIALIPGDERIPVRDWRGPADSGQTRFVEGYLIELQNLPGLSGSPVFVRPSSSFGVGPNERVRAANDGVFLLGVWSSSWDGPFAGAGRSHDVRVPMGMGSVVPTQKLVELFQCDDVRIQRAAWAAKVEAYKATNPSLSPPPEETA